jgi:hypothetical protein
MNKENNQDDNNKNNVLPSFSFSIKEYLHIFDINSLLTLNNFMNTRLNSNISATTVYRIFIYGMSEYQKTVINSPEISINIITNVISFLLKSKKDDVIKEKVNEIYKIILSAKNLDDYKKIITYIEK